jgi:riboflavin kinase
LSEINFIGRIVSGRGEGEKYLRLEWVKQQLTEKLGFEPFPGTLNLQLDQNYIKEKRLLNKKSALGICQSTGYCIGLLFKASIVGQACAVIIPKVKDYPSNLLEIVSEFDLRRELHLSDNDEVEVTVFL